ncbi:CHAT domain-containing protein [Nonomuraea gerenzanensis]|uniref:Kinesin light chain n=1 Tax=Nonomuraea gerenzanensis TaxID=93944 RepID=A0A1M4EEW5_9ACTN|nr:CHAT domain-containing tetratricopeptide repeat protein [Nonomuraea gerenzanensis]UBU08845.1 CHAT domain-containing protein [Nonomuraea gerenzanensis]SBO97208.1 Kinesin light chain [Nonomuraea gerenzanensis]
MTSAGNYDVLRALADDAPAGADTAEAVQATAEALAWCRERLPAGDPGLVPALVRHARAVSMAGQIGSATEFAYELLFDEALAILRAGRGGQDELVAAVLWTYAQCLRRLRPAKCVTTLEEWLGLLRKLRGPSHPDVAAAECRLAGELRQQRRHQEALTHYQESLRIWSLHPPDTWGLMAAEGVGYLAELTGDLGTAADAYAQAVLTAQALGDDSVGTYLVACARVAAGRGEDALPQFEKALAEQRAALGDAHPDVAATWMSISLATSGERALHATREALRAAGAWLESGGATTVGDQRRRDLITVFARYAEHHLSWWTASRSTPAEAPMAEALEVAAWRRRLPQLLWSPWRLPGRRHPGEAELNAVMARIAHRLQDRYQAAGRRPGAAAAEPAWMEHVTELPVLESRQAELETRLWQECRPGVLARPLASTAMAAARRALAADERLVDIMGVEGRYAAFVVGPLDEQSAVVDLGPAARIEQEALRARVTLEGPDRAAAFRDLTPVRAASAGDLRPLAQLLVAPLLPALAGCRRVRMVLDGPLLHVPFGVLPVDAAGSPLLTMFALDYLVTADDLAADTGPGAEPGPELVMAAPDFDLGSVEPGQTGFLFGSLDGTAGEAEGIAGLLGPRAVVLRGDQALKGRLRETRSPRLLHLATHGYVLSGMSEAAVRETDRRLRGTTSELAGRFANLRRHPSLRSGLALAGANRWLAHGVPGPGAETGIFTVADVSALDLSGTALVVLSACDTGVGDLDAVDGHVSLRAAFLRSGAGAVVASLWKVPDLPTRDLMIRFYELLGRGHPPADALRTAQLERHAAVEPVLNWGAFVCYLGARRQEGQGIRAQNWGRS